MELKNYIDKVMDYPKEGIVFRDITLSWQTVQLTNESVKQLVDYARELQVDRSTWLSWAVQLLCKVRDWVGASP